MPHQSFAEFEEAVVRLVEASGATRSDAQGMVMGKRAQLLTLHRDNYTAALAAKTAFGIDALPVAPRAPAGPLARTTDSAWCASLELVSAVRAAQRAACEDGGPMELLLREALESAVTLEHRLKTLAQFAADAARKAA